MSRIRLLLGSAALLVLAAGCAGAESHSPSDSAKVFVRTAHEAQLLGMKETMSRQQVDLSAYFHLMDIKYPPTGRVDVLKALPTRPYQIFAILQGPQKPGLACDDPGLIEGLMSKAQAMGGDAIVICWPANLPVTDQMEILVVKYKLQ